MLRKLRFWLLSDRIGPDLPLTHALLYSRRAGRWLGRRKLKYFADGAEIRPHAYLVDGRSISIGRNVIVRPGCKFFAVSNKDGLGNIDIEDNVLIGSDVHIYVSNHRFSDPEQDIYTQGHDAPRPVKVRRGAWIGARAIILPGVTVGRNAVIGAGSVVTRSVPDFAVAIGSPAKVVRTVSSPTSGAR